MTDEQMMDAAIAEARRGSGIDWPFGAVVFSQGEMLSSAHSRERETHDATAHAELLAVSAATAAAGTRHLPNATLVTTHEPCIMCSGAILAAKIGRVIVGSRRQDLPELFSRRSHDVELLAVDRGALCHVTWGVRREECIALLAPLALRTHA